MSKKPRDYKAEYARRIARGKKRGLSLSQARGHAKSGEAALRPKSIKSDAGLQTALRFMRELGMQKAAAKKAGVSAERLSRFLHENDLIKGRVGRKTLVSSGYAEMASYVDGRAAQLKLWRFDAGSLNGKFMAAVGNFLNTNDYDFIEPFIGQSVRDANGKRHVFETDPNTLYRLSSALDEPFEQNYRLIE